MSTKPKAVTDNTTIGELTEQLNTLYGWAMNEDDGGRTRYQGMTYEDGIKEVVNWLQGNEDRSDIINTCEHGKGL
jgi:hypothetical protein